MYIGAASVILQDKLAYNDGERDAVLLHHEFVVEGWNPNPANLNCLHASHAI